jgi:hypothetical protein
MPWGTWKPTQVRRVARVLGSSMNTVVVETDAGRAYLKAIGNAQGEHALACELIGTSLAEWLGLPTLEFALIELGRTGTQVLLDADESVPIARRRRAQAGAAFITKEIDAETWSGTAADLGSLTNPESIAGLVVLDSWIGNPDRRPRRPENPGISTWRTQNLDNVLLELLPKDKRRLVAMDFSVCLHCRAGGLRGAYDERLVRDDGIYGLFPAFEPYLTSEWVQPFLDRLRDERSLTPHLVELVDRIPKEWRVDARTGEAVQRFLSARARYLADNFAINLSGVIPSPPR